MTSVIADIRYGLRMLLKNPGFTTVAIITLALGIGANSAIFSVVNTVLLRPLPYKDPDRLLVFRERKLPQFPEFSVAPGNFVDWQKQSKAFQQIEALQYGAVNLTGRGEPERLSAVRLTVGTLAMLGVNPAVGRDFRSEEGETGHDNVVLISHSLWQRKFGSDQNLIGQSLDLNGRPYQVIGVMPSSFKYMYGDIDLWTPMVIDTQMQASHGSHYMAAVGKLKSDVSVEQARAEMKTIAERLQQQYPETNKGWDILITPMLESQVGPMERVLWILLSAVGMVLLIACANIANLLLARASARQREIAIRNALGAKRWRIARQLLTESLLLATMGGLAGLVLASWGLEILLALAPKDLPRVQDVSLDGRAIGFTVLITLATGILFGLIPAFQASRPNLMESLKDGGRGVTGGSQLVRSLLVVAEIAIALMLLVGAGLMIKSFLRLTEVNPGFNSKNALVANVNLPETKYPDEQKQAAFFRQVIQQLSTVSGVTAVGLTDSLPIRNDDVDEFHIEGEPMQQQGEHHTANYYVVTPGYFKAMGIPVLQGQVFTDRDVKESRPVVVIGETFAKRYFPNDNAIGKKISIGDLNNYREIIGVVGDVKQYGLNETTPAEVYDPYEQNPGSSVTFVIRTANDPANYSSEFRSQVKAIDKDQPVSQIMTLESIVGESVARQRFSALLLSIFGGLALVLASVGIYGVMAYTVTQRTKEMGLRMALGAQRSDVLKLVVGQGMALAMVGVVLGLLTSFFLTHYIESQLFHVSTADPTTFVGIVVVLSLVSFIASFIPAIRATRVDPMVALRSE